MNYWESVNAAAQILTGKEPEQVQESSRNLNRYWDCVEAAHEVICGNQAGKTTIREGIAAMIQQAALDWLSTEFRGFPKELVKRDLADRTDELYQSWVRFAEKIYGINSNAGQQTGWEMIMGGEYGDPGLTDFPKRGALNQSKDLMSESLDDQFRISSAFKAKIKDIFGKDVKSLKFKKGSVKDQIVVTLSDGSKQVVHKGDFLFRGKYEIPDSKFLTPSEREELKKGRALNQSMSEAETFKVGAWFEKLSPEEQAIIKKFSGGRNSPNDVRIFLKAAQKEFGKLGKDFQIVKVSVVKTKDGEVHHYMKSRDGWA